MGNFARNGGGIACGGPDHGLSVINCSVIGNSGTTGSGGIDVAAGSLAMSNCIVWSNTNNEDAWVSTQVHVHSGVADVNYNCIQDWTGSLGGVGNIGEDPCFAVPGYWDDDT